VRLTLPDIPKSPNRRRGEHWSRSSKYAEYWKQLVRAQIDNSHKPQRKRCTVTISQMRKRALDRDNLWASVKPLVDALTFWCLIFDDSEKWIDLDCRQVIGKEKITIINIEAL
jgi:hypothetical protein